MANLRQLFHGDDKIFPVAHEQGVFDNEGNILSDKLNKINSSITGLKDRVEGLGGSIYEHPINISPALKIGYNSLFGEGQTVTFPQIQEDVISSITLFVKVQEKGLGINFGDVEIYWNSKPTFSRVGIYKIIIERALGQWIGTCTYCLSSNSLEEVYNDIKAKLLSNNFSGDIQVFENEIAKYNEMVITLDSDYSWGDKVKVYYYINNKFYWMCTEKVEQGMIRFISTGAGTYFIASSEAPLYDKDATSLVYSEDFNYTGLPNDEKWKYDVGNNNGWGNDELQYYTKARIENAFVEDGKLNIKAIKEDYDSCKYTSARLVSKDSWIYGRFDIRAKLPYCDTQVYIGTVTSKIPLNIRKTPSASADILGAVVTGGTVEIEGTASSTGWYKVVYNGGYGYCSKDYVSISNQISGIWSAIWMLPEDNAYGAWANSGELDIMENIAKDKDYIHATLSSANYNFKDSTQITAKTAVGDNQTEFHTYSMVWTPEYIEFLVDDVSYLKQETDTVLGADRWRYYPYDKKFNLILNVAVGGNWGGQVATNIFPQQMQIDSIKIYDLGFNTFNVQKPETPINLQFNDNTLSWNYCYDNIGVNYYEVALNNGIVLTTELNSISLSDVILQGATNVDVVAVDFNNNRSQKASLSLQAISGITSLYQSDFSSLEDWKNYVETGEGARATFTAEDNKAIVNIANGGTLNWHIQFTKPSIALQVGKTYQFAVILTSTIDRDVTMVLQNKSTYENYTMITQSVKANKKSVVQGSLTKAGDSDLDANFILFLGNESGVDYGANVIKIERVEIIEIN